MSHYEILGLDPRDKHSLADIKLAYRQTLLTHHPDKLESTVRPHVTLSASSKSLSGTVPSVDAIVSAFHVLSDPSTRAEYDSVLQTEHKNAVLRGKPYDHAGLDSFDLEDLVFEEDATSPGSWYKGCRCGQERGFVVTEKDLEEASGEDDKTTGCSASRSILVECTGCSLLIRITFAVEPG